MSLSPLYEAGTSDLHVNTAAGLHQPFGGLRPRLAKITTFRVYVAPLGGPGPARVGLRFRCVRGSGAGGSRRTVTP